MRETFSDLLPFTWRGKGAPLQRIRMTIAHDLVQHKAWGVNGAYVEDTGLAPVRLTATIPFVNLIAKGETEEWPSGDLYPTGFRQFVLDFQDRRAGLVTHPEFGSIACKPENLEFELAADQRSGVIVEASWVEALDDEVRHNVVNGVVNLDAAAITFDTQQVDLRKIVPQLPEYEGTFEDLARAVTGVADQIAILSQRQAGALDRIEYRAKAMQTSINRARSALTWPATQQLERLKASANDLRDKLLQANRDIVLYQTKGAATLAGLLPEMPGATLSDVIKLNPGLVKSPVIPARTTVRYYLPKAA